MKNLQKNTILNSYDKMIFMKEFHIKDFGAVGDGVTLNTVAIQKAIDDCALKNGGTGLLEDGIYMTGSITLRSNVNLHISRNAVLLGSPDCKDYPEKQNLKHVISENLPRNSNACMIFAEESENISITGMGKIDCNGTSFVKAKHQHRSRKRLAYI